MARQSFHFVNLNRVEGDLSLKAIVVDGPLNSIINRLDQSKEMCRKRDVARKALNQKHESEFGGDSISIGVG
jgi:hypothetical protein